MTIVEAIKQVMKTKGRPLTAAEAYEAIIGAGLYTFNTKNPLAIVTRQIRRHCKDLDPRSGSNTKHFEIRGENAYFYLEHPIRESKPAS